MTTHLRAGIATFGALGVACLVAVAGCAPKVSVTTGSATLSFTRLTLERKPCYGMCPVYLLSIANDGSVVFEGRNHVDSVGIMRSRIDMNRVASLQKLIDENQFNSLDDKYGDGTPNCGTYYTDAPRAIISVTSRGGVKTVEHDRGCQGAPTRLTYLENKIDEIANVSRWTTRQPTH